MRPRSSLGLLVAGTLVVSCLPGGKLPEIPAPAARGNATLRPTEASLPPDEGPLKVLHASPEGEEVEGPLPTILFSRSMHRLGAPPGEPAVEATIDPPVEGTWRWVGSRALQFSPRQAFADATSYRVEVKPGLRSLDGQTIREAIQLRFATPRLALSGMELRDRVEGALRIDFNDRVSPEEFIKAFSLVDEQNRPVPFTFTAKTPARSFQLKPKGRWPEDTELRARLRPVRGLGGPLGMKEPVEQTLLQRKPHVIERLDCESRIEGDLCRQSTDIEIRLSEPMGASQLAELITIEPRLPFKLKSYSRERTSNQFYLRAGFNKNTRYTIKVRSTAKRGRGQPGLDVGSTFSFLTAGEEPTGELLVHGTYLQPQWTDELAATAERVSGASFSVSQVKLADLLRQHVEGGKLRASKDGRRTRGASDLKGEWTTVDLGDLMPAGPGPVLLEGVWQNKDRTKRESKLIQRTDLGLTFALSREGSLAWVTRLSTGVAVPEAEVEIHDGVGRKVTARTDAQGVALLDIAALGAPEEASDREPSGENREPSDDDASTLEKRANRNGLLVVARSGEDWLYRDATMPSEASAQGALFTDRDVYRPGEDVYVKGVVRRSSSKGPQTLAGREVKLVIVSPDQPPLEIIKKLSAWGSFSHEFKLPRDAPARDVRIGLFDGRNGLDGNAIQVRHVREVSFKVEGSLDRGHYMPGDEVRCSGHASYLYGGSMQSMRYSASIAMRPWRFEPPGVPDGFTVGKARRHSWAPQRLANKAGQLGPDGALAEQVRLPEGPLEYAQQLTCELDVVDAGQQQVEHKATAVVHPANFYLAMSEKKAERYVTPERAGKPVEIEVMALAPGGERRAEQVTVELREVQRVVSKKQEEEDTIREEKVSSCELKTSAQINATTTCKVLVPRRYDVSYVVEAFATDSKGRKSASELRFRTESQPKAPPPPPPKPGPPPPPPPPPPLALRPERATYKAGEAARFAIEAPRPISQSLVLATREGIFAHRVLDGAARSFDLATSEFMGPWFTTLMYAIDPIPRATPFERIEDQPRFAQQRMHVERSSRTLQVAVTPSKSEAAPGDTIEVDVSVSGAGGQIIPAEVTLYAVNEGMLLLSDYKTPDLSQSLRIEGQQLVTTDDTRNDLGWIERPLRQGWGTGSGQGFGSGHGRLGGVGGSSTPTVRADFRPTPLFAPSLETDEKGHAHASFKLPDSLTSYRIMAVAASKADHFGKAESTIKVSLPAQLRPVVPMTIRAGDRFEVPAVAANNTNHPLDLTASVEVEGFTVAGPSSRALRLEPGTSERVTFPIEARRSGPGKMTFRLRGEGAGDVVEIPTEITPPASLEASAVYGKTSQAVEEQVADLGAIRPDAGFLEVTLSSSPVAGLGAGLDQLVQYPYGCTEQTVSRLVPLLSLRDLARSLGVALPADVGRESQQAVERLLKNRNKDGQFGLWPGSTPSPWITAYAIWGLADASRRGIPIDDKVFRGAERYLGEVALGWPRGEQQAAEASFALDVLADLPGVADATRAQALLLARQIAASPQGLPDFGRSMLLHAMARLGAGADELAPQIKALEASLHLDGPVARAVERGRWMAALLDSRARSSALALRALLTASPKHPLIEPLALGLVQDRGPKGWRTTQETAWALLALDAYQKTQATDALQASARMGPKTLLSALLSGPTEQRVKLPMSELGPLGGALRFDASGGGTLHYQARLSYAPVALPTEPLAVGIEISRRCRAIDGLSDAVEAADRGATGFKVGQWVGCTIDVTTPSPRAFVVIDAPIPGGFELADPALSGTPGFVRHHTSGHQDERELRADRALFFVDQLSAGTHRFGYVARAMTAGQFQLPPARAEEMYTPETYGRTDAEVVRIAP